MNLSGSASTTPMPNFTLSQLCKQLRTMPKDSLIEGTSHVSAFGVSFELSGDVKHSAIEQSENWIKRRVPLGSITKDFVSKAQAIAFEGVAKVSVANLLAVLQPIEAEYGDVPIMFGISRVVGVKQFALLETDDEPFRRTEMALSGEAAYRRAFELARTMAAAPTIDSNVIVAAVHSVLPQYWRFAAYRVGTDLYSDRVFLERYPRVTVDALAPAFHTVSAFGEVGGRDDDSDALERVVIHTAHKGITHEVLLAEFGPRKTDEALIAERLARLVREAQDDQASANISSVAAAESS